MSTKTIWKTAIRAVRSAIKNAPIWLVRVADKPRHSDDDAVLIEDIAWRRLNGHGVNPNAPSSIRYPLADLSRLQPTTLADPGLLVPTILSIMTDWNGLDIDGCTVTLPMHLAAIAGGPTLEILHPRRWMGD